MALKHLKRAALFLVLASPAALASDLSLSIRRVDGPGWRAENIEVQLLPPKVLQLRIGAITLTGQAPIQDLKLSCRELMAGQGARCDKAKFTAIAPGLGKLDGTARFEFHSALRWQAALALPSQGLQLALTQDAAQINAELHAKDFNFSEASGRYAAEKLSADVKLSLHNNGRAQIALETQGGQVYAEPVFADFGVLPLKLDAALIKNAKGWGIERWVSVLGKAGRVEASGQLDADFKLLTLMAAVQAQDLAPLVATAVQPFLIGSKLDGFTASGRAHAQLAVHDGALQSLSAKLEGVSFAAEKLGLSLDDIRGDLNWSPIQSTASQLKWAGGAIKKIALGGAQLAFRAQGRDFELLETWRQPLLEGALKVERLNLRGLGQAQLSADFSGALEPLNLTALCKALGWPEFTGTLAGRLPGLTVRDDVWTIDGALEAQLFDGNLRVSKLQAVQPFGVLPRVMADLEMRRLDLERLTRTFSFGRITGRLDGEVKNLRLLNWSPVAFDGRLYSTPDDDSKHRISQRAIDNISAIGGGPTGFLAHGFMSVFEDFGYDRLGISCVLRDGICQMDGVEPAGSAEGQKGYYLVKGAWLPRINVVGYAQRVSWTNLLSQLKSAQASGGPKLE